MGSGKTSTGRALSDRIGFEFVDTDTTIEQKCGMPVREIFKTQGEAAFREMERTVLKNCFVSSGRVLATGGGLWMNAENRSALLQNAWCVYLRVSPERAWDRVKENLQERPLLATAPDPLGKIREMLAARGPIYELAHATIETDGRSPAAVAGRVVELLKDTRPFDLSSLPI